MTPIIVPGQQTAPAATEPPGPDATAPESIALPSTFSVDLTPLVERALRQQ